MKQPDKITIDDVEYVRADSSKPAETFSGMPYVICRTYSAGVFAGYLEKRNNREVTLRKARRLWKWEGAASLSQLAMSGTSKPKACKFPEEVDRVLLLEAVEVLDCTSRAQLSIAGVVVWVA